MRLQFNRGIEKRIGDGRHCLPVIAAFTSVTDRGGRLSLGGRRRILTVMAGLY